jgi:hypothetical protein
MLSGNGSGLFKHSVYAEPDGNNRGKGLYMNIRRSLFESLHDKGIDKINNRGISLQLLNVYISPLTYFTPFTIYRETVGQEDGEFPPVKTKKNHLSAVK